MVAPLEQQCWVNREDVSQELVFGDQCLSTDQSLKLFSEASESAILAILYSLLPFACISYTAVPHGSVCYCLLLSSVRLWPHGAARLVCQWDFPGKNTGEGCHFLLQGVFLTEGWTLPMSPALAGGFFTTEPPRKTPIVCKEKLRKIHNKLNIPTFIHC